MKLGTNPFSFPCAWAGLCLLLTVHLPGPGHAGQYTSRHDSAAALFSQAVALERQQQVETAEQKLVQVLQLDPRFRDERRGSAWLVLGEMLESENKDLALRTYLKGLDVFEQDSVVDIRLNLAFVRLAVQLEKKSAYERATQSFYDILDHATIGENAQLLTRLFAQCEFLLPEALKKAFEHSMKEGDATCRPGRLLRRFWRSKDPTPATLVNERLMEHLQRVEYAEEYFYAAIPRRFDDRGMLYVKLGRPSGKASAGLSGRDLARNYSFRPHEVWFYEFIDPNVYFPFVDFQDKRRYVLVDGIEEALPRASASNKWRAVVPRGRVLPDSLALGISPLLDSETPDLDTRLYFYKQLATTSRHFYDRVQELESILTHKEVEFSPFPTSYYNHLAVTTMTSRDLQEETYREQNTPQEASDTFAAVENLPVAFRTARFLEPGGETRFELYLGMRKRDLVADRSQLGADLLVKLTATTENTELMPQPNPDQVVIFTNVEDDRSTDVFAETLTLHTAVDSFYVSGQAESWLAHTESGQRVASNENPGNVRTVLQFHSDKLLRMVAFRTGLQHSLASEGSKLLLSDLVLSKKISATGPDSTRRENLRIEPYPFEQVDPGRPIFVYFEIYGLSVPTNEPARYRVAYEAREIKSKRSLWSKVKSVFGSREGSQVEVESDFETLKSEQKEWVSLD
ncbi:MAG: GWxTD domain-containing protein, partial [Calditrichaeota bacterium]